MRIVKNQIIDKLKYYFSIRKEVAFAFLFGSVVKGNAGLDSDLDIAVYFYPHKEGFDIEEDVSFREEDEIWRNLEQIVGEEVDLVVLNRSAATIAAAVYLEGIPIIISNHSLYWKHFLTVTDLAEEYRQFTKDYIAVKSRSLSLSAIDKDRLTGKYY
ncbi:MAG: nucleotidyltransferase domain-containing protein [Spirochaetes bacterium]|nr:nucleotidyltransferase domain-containing protein [Spirochaetota bacterium]